MPSRRDTSERARDSEEADNHDTQDSQSNSIQALYNSVSASIVRRLASSEKQEAPQDISSGAESSPDDVPGDAWYSDLLHVLESLGASPKPCDNPEDRPSSGTPLEKSVAEQEAENMAWLTEAKAKLDDLAARIQGVGWGSSAASDTAVSRDKAAHGAEKPPTEAPESDAADEQDSSVKGRLLAQIRAIQGQLNQRIDSAREALEDGIQNMLPLQLQRQWLTECAQICLDREIHPDLHETASVRLGHSICGQEADFQERRAQRIREDFARFIGEAADTVDICDIPIIGVAGSGGGFRAMVATLGSYRAMELAGLAQCVTYDAAVSGSSWAIAALHTYGSGDPFKVLDSVKEAMKTSMFSTSSLTDFMAENDAIAKRVFTDMAARYLLSAVSRHNTDASDKSQTSKAEDKAALDESTGALSRILGDIAQRGSQLVGSVLSGQLYAPSTSDAAMPVSRTVEELLQAAESALRSHPLPPMSFVDLYGALLFRKLIVRHTKGTGDDASEPLELDPQWVRLSAQRAAVDQAKLPMPIYTAVRHFIGTNDNDPEATPGHKYQWFELGPYEVGSIDHGAWIPTWAFGRPMGNGQEQLWTGEAHFGSIMGAVSSAFCASVKAMVMEIYMAAPAIVRGAMDPLLDRFDHDAERSHPIPPYTLHNPFYGTNVPDCDGSSKQSELGKAPLLSLMDAGMENNLPFAPLLRPERKVDVVLCLDASADIEVMPWFARAERWAYEHGVERWPWGARPWAANALRPSKSEEELARNMLHGTQSVRKSIDRRIKEDNVRCVVFDQPVAPAKIQSRTPREKGNVAMPITLIYLPLLPNQEFRDPEFDPATADFCATFNDKWTSEQVDTLADLAAFNLTQEIERIREAVAGAYRRKRAYRLYREGLQD
ncbi:hypothetical protein GGF46_002898 [Coemansia sp. RSA 552]|nr:hypothetical protein GGF46_002898 [Coemansia sp. RSA 552]